MRLIQMGMYPVKAYTFPTAGFAISTEFLILIQPHWARLSDSVFLLSKRGALVYVEIANIIVRTLLLVPHLMLIGRILMDSTLVRLRHSSGYFG
jgi:hypothetical protein